MKLNNVLIEKIFLKVNKLHPPLNRMVPPHIFRNGIRALSISRNFTGNYPVIDMRAKCYLNQLYINDFLYNFLEWIIEAVILLDSICLKLHTGTSTHTTLNLPLNLIESSRDLLGPFSAEQYHIIIPLNNSPLIFITFFCHVFINNIYTDFTK